jgi:hypothetical protein
MILAWAWGRVTAVCLAGGLFVAGCGSATTNAPPPKVPDIGTQIDADAIAVLPGAAALVVSFDARAFYASGSGAGAAPLVDMVVPAWPESGFVASRDLDRITLGVYLSQGADVSAVVIGRFDPPRLDQAIQSHAAQRPGTVTISQYAGHTLYMTSDAGFTILTPHTALAGTQTGIKRALDRVQEHRLQRDIPKWMSDVLETNGASVAVAGDLANQQVGQIVAMAPWMSGPWLNNLRTLRVLGDFHDPGFNVAGTLTYADAPSAQASAGSLRSLGTAASFASALSSAIPQLRGLDIQVADTNVQAKFAVDDQALRRMLQTVSQARPSK